MLDSRFTDVRPRTVPAAGAGLSVKLNRVIEFPAYSPGMGSYSRAGLRLLYSAGNPTWRIDPMSFT
ncbi:MAG: hypothetical protein OXJ53_20290 [Gammaproteobacteria bacterium]|nr:hypothetical protein [Gammaproteobacteria bacterium]